MNGYILITKNCNMSCEYCYYNIGMIEKDHAIIEETTLYNAISWLNQMGVTSIQFTGGECFTAIEQLKKGVIYAKKLGIKVIVATNLKLLVERENLLYEDWIKEIDEIVTSIHIDKNTEKCYYNNLVDCIKRINQSGKKIRTIYTISAVNYMHTTTIINDCKSMGVELMLQLVSTKGTKKEIDCIYSLEHLEQKSKDKIISDLRSWVGDDKDGNTYVNQLIKYLTNQSMELDNCSAGKDFLVINPNGEVHPCFTLENFCFGNVNGFVDVEIINEFYAMEKSCADLFCVCKSIKY